MLAFAWNVLKRLVPNISCFALTLWVRVWEFTLARLCSHKTQITDDLGNPLHMQIKLLLYVSTQLVIVVVVSYCCSFASYLLASHTVNPSVIASVFYFYEIMRIQWWLSNNLLIKCLIYLGKTITVFVLDETQVIQSHLSSQCPSICANFEKPYTWYCGCIAVFWWYRSRLYSTLILQVDIFYLSQLLRLGARPVFWYYSSLVMEDVTWCRNDCALDGSGMPVQKKRWEGLWAFLMKVTSAGSINQSELTGSVTEHWNFPITCLQ